MRPTERPSRRALDEIAIENAREGCVRETFGALVAMHQAERASDPTIRRAMNRIAEDETRHALLAWEVASWADSKLDAEARARIETTKQKAFEDLALEASFEPVPELRTTAGMPSAAQAKRMVAALRDLTSKLFVADRA